MDFIINSMTGPGPLLTLSANSETIILGAAHLRSTAGPTIDTVDSNISLRIMAGSIIEGQLAAITFQNGLATNRRIQIDAGAVVKGSDGIYITGDGFEVVNAGQLVCNGNALVYQLAVATYHGTIVNSGLIAGGNGITSFAPNYTGVLDITNSGTILVSGEAFRASSNCVTTFVNTGDIDGTMVFGNKDDSFNNAAGILRDSADMSGGNDTVNPGLGIENLNGGTGTDLLDFSTQGAIRLFLDGFFTATGAAAGDVYGAFENIKGSATGADALGGNFDQNQIDGQGGHDTIYGGADSDTLIGGTGNDSLDGGIGVDRLEGGLGNDHYVIDDAGDGVIELAGGGTDTLFTTVNATLAAEIERGVVIATLGTSLSGNTLSNRLTGGLGGDTLNGSSGNDTLLSSSSGDSLDGGSGNDSLDGGTGVDTMRGGTGNDVFVIDSSGEVVIELAGGGTDLLRTGVNATLAAEVENGFIIATSGRSLSGNGLANRLTGGVGNDRLSGLGASDVLSGGSGNDTLGGGTGADTLTGGLGADRFLFISRTEGVDRVTDFSTGDKVRVSAAGFGGGLAAGALSASAFVTRADNLAQDANDRFIFRTTDHSLWFDQNGTAAGGLTQLAVFGSTVTLTAADILII